VEVVVGHGLFDDDFDGVALVVGVDAQVTPSMVLRAFPTVCSQPLHDIPVTEIVFRCIRGHIGSKGMTIEPVNQTFSSQISRP